MDFTFWILAAWLAAGCLYWLRHALAAVAIFRTVPRLERLNPTEPARWPKVSLIIPACNEANTLEAAMRSRLAADYPDLEFILIDDRSTDGTGEIVDRIAAGDPRVRPVHIMELPPGWLGKVHAMHRGAGVATGEWLLFSDADVHFEPGMLRRTVAWCVANDLDHLAAFPTVESAGFWLDVVLAGFLRLLLVGVRPWAIADPASDAAMGVGAFNLVRRSALERTAGFDWLKMEPGDDVALAMLIKRSGGRSRLVNACRHLRVRWYGSVREMAIGSERGGFTILGRFSFARAIVVGAVMLALEVAPFVALAAAGMPLVQAIGAVAAVVAVATSVAFAAWAGGRVVPALLVPVGSVVLISFVWRAGYLGWRRGGIYWRGTLYRTQVLRKGARVRFP